jgi:hypothetical protein
MNTNPLTGAMLTQNAILVTQGINPCGCTITCIGVKDNQATLSVGQITSPLATQQFANGLVHSTELHIFRLAGRTPNPIHLKGKVTQDNNQGVVFTCQPLSEVLSELQAITIPPDPQPETENILPIDSLIQVYNRQGSVLLSNLLSVFLEEVTTGIDHTLAAASELREINRLKDMRFIFYSRQKQIFQDFEARFTATNETLASGQASHGQQDELHLLQRKVFEDWLELQTIHPASESDIQAGHNQLKQPAFTGILMPVFTADDRPAGYCP